MIKNNKIVNLEKKSVYVEDDMNEEIKCKHIFLIVEKAFENVNSIDTLENTKIVYSCIQQGLNRDKIFTKEEIYEILQAVSSYLYSEREGYATIDVEKNVMIHSLIMRVLDKKLKNDVLVFQVEETKKMFEKANKIISEMSRKNVNA